MTISSWALGLLRRASEVRSEMSLNVRYTLGCAAEQRGVEDRKCSDVDLSSESRPT